jgi:hypothetical protein
MADELQAKKRKRTKSGFRYHVQVVFGTENEKKVFVERMDKLRKKLLHKGGSSRVFLLLIELWRRVWKMMYQKMHVVTPPQMVHHRSIISNINSILGTII